MRTSIRSLVPTLVAIALVGCGVGGGTSTVRGHVTDGSGAQPQEARPSGDTFGGSGTVSQASTVKLSRINANGSLELVTTANVNADGSYQLSAPAGEDKLVCQAFSSSGQVVASAIIETTGEAGQTVTATPMDTESSVEAEVMVEMIAQGTSVAEANAIDLRARINSRVAAAVRSTASSGGDAHAKIKVLAEATIAAQRTQIRAYAQAGVTVTQQMLFDAELQAAQHLNASLESGSQASKAYADFLAELDAAIKARGASATQQAQAERSASASFRATLKARLQTSGTVDPVMDAGLRAAASLEAHSSAVAMEAILRAGGASQAVIDSAVSAGATLQQQLSAAATASATAQAFANFRTSVEGSGDVSGSVLGSYLEVNVVTKTSAQAAVTAAVTAAATLDATLSTTFGVALEAAGAVDFNTMANSVVDAYATFDNTVRAQAATLAVFGAKAQPSVDLVIVAQGSMKVGG